MTNNATVGQIKNLGLSPLNDNLNVGADEKAIPIQPEHMEKAIKGDPIDDKQILSDTTHFPDPSEVVRQLGESKS